MSTWQDHHLVAPEDVAEHVEHLDKVRSARQVIIPVWGLVHSITWHLGEHTSVSLGEIGERSYYLHTTYTHPDHRGNGELRRAMTELYRLVGAWDWTLYTHPADPWLQSRLVRNGWTPLFDKPEWFTNIGEYRDIPCYALSSEQARNNHHHEIGEN